ATVLERATLHEALRAELARTHEALRNFPEESERALAVAVDMLDSAECSLTNTQEKLHDAGLFLKDALENLTMLTGIVVMGADDECFSFGDKDLTRFRKVAAGLATNLHGAMGDLTGAWTEVANIVVPETDLDESEEE